MCTMYCILYRYAVSIGSVVCSSIQCAGEVRGHLALGIVTTHRQVVTTVKPIVGPPCCCLGLGGDMASVHSITYLSIHAMLYDTFCFQ